MKRVLLLGRNGMLGDAVSKYFLTQADYEIVTNTERWPSDGFVHEIVALKPDFIINAIGKIPQRKPTEVEYLETNVDLPLFLNTLGIKVIHPSTDCEFSGDLPIGNAYSRTSLRDAHDTYGISKATVSSQLEIAASYTKIIRTSIIGHELHSHVSLLDWFLQSETSVRGYTNHYWNGITTLMWAQLAKRLMDEWNSFPVLNQYATLPYHTKYEILTIMREVYDIEIEIAPFETEEPVNKK
jgi:dTDP-4-dehydrorhamnose reductase